MFLKHKKGNIVAQFTVLLIIAVIMITIVSFFGVKVTSIFFPDPDRSSVQSFDMINTVINAMLASSLDYESQTVGTYMAKNYEMVLFYEPTLSCKNNPVIVTDGDGKNPQILESDDVYYAPKECGTLKCICLYDDDPVANKENKKNQNVVKCHTFKEDLYKVNIHPDHFNLNDGVCSRDSRMKYSSLIIAKHKPSEPASEQGKEYLYIMKDNDANRQLDEKWSINLCPVDPGNPGGNCAGKTADSMVIPTNDEEADKIYQHCLSSESVPYKSTHAVCTYKKTENKCLIDCAHGDVTNKCHTQGYSYCSDFNVDRGVNNEKYVDLTNSFEKYTLCSRDADFCNLGCQADNWKTFVCKGSDTGAATSNIASCALPSGCAPEFLADTGVLKDFLKSYDESKTECKDFVDANFSKDHIILECNLSNAECKDFVFRKRTECSLKYINSGDIYWITYYDPACEAEVKNFFDKAYFCTDKPQTP